MSYKGRFLPKNPDKYIGDPTGIIYRSLLELKAMQYMDLHKAVLKWGSEELVIPYVSPADGRTHRYFVDFYLKVQTAKGEIKEALIEVKPSKQLKPPKVPLKKTRRYLNEVATFAINQAKWAAATEICEAQGWDFLKWTEKELRY